MYKSKQTRSGVVLGSIALHDLPREIQAALLPYGNRRTSALKVGAAKAGALGVSAAIISGSVVAARKMAELNVITVPADAIGTGIVYGGVGLLAAAGVASVALPLVGIARRKKFAEAHAGSLVKEAAASHPVIDGFLKRGATHGFSRKGQYWFVRAPALVGMPFKPSFRNTRYPLDVSREIRDELVREAPRF